MILSVPKRKRNNRVNVHEAKTHLSRLIERVEGGESIVICRAGKPVAKLVAANGQPAAGKRAGFGYAKGLMHYTPDAFAPLNDDELKAWYDDDAGDTAPPDPE
jgi:prevent-host-death family protein